MRFCGNSAAGKGCNADRRAVTAPAISSGQAVPNPTCGPAAAGNAWMTGWRHLTSLTGCNLLKIRQSRQVEPSTVVRFFRRIVGQWLGGPDLFALSDVELRSPRH